MAAHEVRLDGADAAELVELLGFLGQWFDRDAEVLAALLRRFVGSDGYDLAGLRADLDRFAFLLGGDGDRFIEPGSPAG
ncbi:MAG TPA: hypothetical protein VMB79_13560 [Jatrophihabitans sp.]|nr:hypothetical protein [Jatrophihabitans sp.]